MTFAAVPGTAVRPALWARVTASVKTYPARDVLCSAGMSRPWLAPVPAEPGSGAAPWLTR